MLRMLPPEIERRESAARSSWSVGAFARKHSSPDFCALRLIGKRESHDETQPTEEGRVERFLHVGCQDGEPAIGLHSLQKVADLDVGITIVAVFHLAPFAEERVGFVEKQDRATFLGGIEQTAQIFLRLADVLAHDRAEIDPIKIEPQFVRQNFRREGFTRAARPGKECAQTEPAIGLLGETPVVVDPRPLPQMLGDRLQGVQLGRG